MHNSPRPVSLPPRIMLRAPFRKSTALLLSGMALLASGRLGAPGGDVASLEARPVGLVVPNGYELAQLPELSRSHTSIIGGLIFREGELGAVRCVVVVSGLGPVNSATATTLLITRFRPRWVLMYGIAGSTSAKINYADVVVPASWGSTDLWVWTRAGYNSSDSPLPLEGIDYSRAAPNAEFVFPGYANNPVTGTFYVQEAEIMRETEENPSAFDKQLFFPADPTLLDAARRVAKQVKLLACLPADATDCLPVNPTVVLDENITGVSGSIFADNAAWRDFLASTYNTAVADMETAAMAQVCAANGVPYIAVRSASDLAGGDSGQNAAMKFIDLAAKNSALMAAALVKAAPAGVR